MKIPFEKIFEADLFHPLEQEALRECQKNPLFDWLANEAAALKNRVSDRSEASLSFFPVTKLTAPRLNRLYETALNRLGCKERYPLYLKFDYAIKFEVSGSDEDSYIITVNDVVAELSDEEILALFGQAIGRIKACHVHNLQLIKILSGIVSALPFGDVAQKALWGAFAAWTIASQYSIDRAGLFACGSERAVESLIMKQIGVKDFDLQEILSKSINRPRELGVYFIWVSQKLPAFGGIERIQELHNWIRSKEFKRDYPCLYFRALLEDETADEENLPQLELHRAAFNGNINAQIALGEKYLSGKELPPSPFMAELLFKTASFCGDARAMYIFAAILEKFHGEEISSKIIQRLYEASADRGFEPALKKIGALSVDEDNPAVEKVCAEFDSNYDNQTACKTTLDAETKEKIRDAFWINPHEKILAAEIFSSDDETLGIALTASAVYGRLSEKTLPFRFSWQNICDDGIYRRQLRDDKNYLTVGDKPIYCVGEVLRGTMAELIIKLAKS